MKKINHLKNNWTQKQSNILTITVFLLLFITLPMLSIFELYLESSGHLTNSYRFYTFQSNFIVFVGYGFMTLGMFVNRFSRLKDKHYFRIAIKIVIMITILLVSTLLLPLYIMKLFNYGPGTFGSNSFPNTGGVVPSGFEGMKISFSVISNGILHLMVPLLVIIHYFLDLNQRKKWKKTVWYTNWKKIGSILIFPILYLFFSILLGEIYGWYPYSIFNHNMWGIGWWAVVLFIIAVSAITLLALKMTLIIEKKIMKSVK